MRPPAAAQAIPGATLVRVRLGLGYANPNPDPNPSPGPNQALPKPFWHEVLELCGGECAELSRLGIG